MKKNRVSIVINDFGASWDDWDYFIGKTKIASEYDSEKFECLDAKEKILVYAESDDVYTMLLKVYYEAAKICEKLASERRKKYNQCHEFHEYGNIITMRLDIAENGPFPDDLSTIEVNSVEVGYDKSSLFSALAECFYKMLDNIIQKEQFFLSVTSRNVPFKKVKMNCSEVIKWQLDSDT